MEISIYSDNPKGHYSSVVVCVNTHPGVALVKNLRIEVTPWLLVIGQQFVSAPNFVFFFFVMQHDTHKLFYLRSKKKKNVCE